MKSSDGSYYNNNSNKKELNFLPPIKYQWLALLSIFAEEIGVRNGKDNNKNIYLSTEILSLLR